MALALDQVRCEIAVIASRGFCYDPCFPLGTRLEALRRRPPRHKIDVTFEYPLHYPRLNARFKVGLLVYETTELPPAWVEAIEKHINLLIVPSHFCRKLAIDCGVSPERVEVIPYGYNPLLFHPWVLPGCIAHEDRFIFLCVAMPHIRKGVMELIQAFVEEFDSQEPVSLVIKTAYLPRRNKMKRDWEIHGLLECIQSLCAKSLSDQRILLIAKAWTPEEMPGLYASSHAYVQPSCSEGFGLSILEAKAVGRPTVVTGWGGHMETE